MTPKRSSRDGMGHPCPAIAAACQTATRCGSITAVRASRTISQADYSPKCGHDKPQMIHRLGTSRHSLRYRSRQAIETHLDYIALLSTRPRTLRFTTISSCLRAAFSASSRPFPCRDRGRTAIDCLISSFWLCRYVRAVSWRCPVCLGPQADEAKCKIPFTSESLGR